MEVKNVTVATRMANGYIGQLLDFDENNDVWSNYEDRLDEFISLNDVADAKKVSLLIASVGSKTYALLKDLAAPTKPNTMTYVALTKLLRDHFCPQPLKYAERYKLRERKQHPEESMHDYVAALRKLAKHCQFGTFLDEALTMQLISGVKCSTTQKRLLVEKDLTFAKATEIASSYEQATANTEMMSSNSSSNLSVNKFNPTVNHNQQRQNQRQRFPSCTHCGKQNHAEENCYNKLAYCSKCGQQGHMRAVCRNRRMQQRQPQRRRNNSRWNLNMMQDGDNDGRADQINEETSAPQYSSSHYNGESQVKHSNFNPNNLMLNNGAPSYESLDYIGHDQVVNFSNETNPTLCKLNIFDGINTGSDVFLTTVNIDGVTCKMEIDTGSKYSLMNEGTFNQLFPHRKLQPTNIMLRTYSGEKLLPVGFKVVNALLGGTLKRLRLYILPTNGPTLFGRDWIRAFQGSDIPQPSLLNISKSSEPRNESSFQKDIDELVSKYDDLFSTETGTLRGVQGTLYLKDNAVPKFCRARPVPFALRERVENELDRLVSNELFYPVSWSNWASPVVPVVKKDGSVRLCGDFKQTINPCLNPEQYPIPKVDDIFAKLAGGKYYAKLDLRQAYLQMMMDDKSQELLTINTHKGLFRSRRLLYGVNSAPGIWQRNMEQVIQGLDGVEVILDDMIVTGKSKEHFLHNLELLLQRLRDHGLKLNREKCKFLEKQIAYCGHIIDANGLHKMKNKVDAITQAPAPTNVSQLRSFLGLVNYYHKFLPNVSTLLHPLHKLLEANVPWKWSSDCDRAFAVVKQYVASDTVLTHYDPSLPINIECDASSYGIGAVMTHVMPDGSEKPVLYASRSLTKTERNYSQLDKEALSIIFGVQKFYNYIYLRHFTIITDHKPLTHIFSPSKGIPVMSAARLQRYAIQLAAHNYSIKYRSTSHHANADFLSRFPVDTSNSSASSLDYADVFYTQQLINLPVSAEAVRKLTNKDKTLSRVLASVNTGQWVNDTTTEHFYSKRDELSVVNGCIVWGPRVVIPEVLRSDVLKMLHVGHLGIDKIKGVARSYVWWPNIDKDIESYSARCEGCLQARNIPQPVELHNWPQCHRPLERVHIDFAGPIDGLMHLIIVDAYSKWPEVITMKSTTSRHIMNVLFHLFCRIGFPETLVSDNAPHFVSYEFEQFLKNNSITHKLSAPYHAATNGLAERFVATFKSALTKFKYDEGPQSWKISRFLMAYRNAPHSLTRESPSKLFCCRMLRTNIDCLQPSTGATVSARMENIRSKRGGRKTISLEVGKDVAFLNFSKNGSKWLRGKVSAVEGPLTYLIRTSDNRVYRRHFDQIIIQPALSYEKTTVRTEDFAFPTPTPAMNNEEVPSPSRQSPRRYPARVRSVPTRYGSPYTH